MGKWMAGLISVLLGLLFLSQGYSREKLLNPGELYDSYMALYHKGKCEEAIRGFSKIVQSAPASKLASYSQYMIGICYLKVEKYEEAVRQFELYLKNYPDSDRVSEAQSGVRTAKERLKEKPRPASGVSDPAVKKSLPEIKRAKRRICVQVPYL
jgi:tetratricopeptide (TPR) repeat protein